MSVSRHKKRKVAFGPPFKILRTNEQDMCDLDKSQIHNKITFSPPNLALLPLRSDVTSQPDYPSIIARGRESYLSFCLPSTEPSLTSPNLS